MRKTIGMSYWINCIQNQIIDKKKITQFLVFKYGNLNNKRLCDIEVPLSKPLDKNNGNQL